MKRPLCVFCLAIVLTQVAAVYLPLNLLLILAAFFAICLMTCFVVKHHGYCICILLGLACGGCIFAANQERNLAKVEPYLNQTVTITARVDAPYASYVTDMINATLRIESVNGKPASFLCCTVLMPQAEAGELIQADFLISDLSKETNRLSNYSEGIFAQAQYIDGFTSIGSAKGLRGFLIATQARLSRVIRAPFSKEVGGVLAAMTVGDRAYLLDSVSDHYRTAGLSHVLVVSGLHLSLACGIVMIRKTSLWARIVKSVLTMSIALFLAGLVGATASVLRAVFVLFVYTVGQLIDESADSFTSLSLAGAILIFTNGYAVCSLSFQLSFLATAGVLAGSSFAQTTLPKLQTKIFACRWLQQIYTGIMITLFASFATFPILVLWNMNISLLSVLSNLCTVWMMPFILLLGFAGALVVFLPFCGWLSTLLITSAAILVAVLNRMVAVISLLPGGRLYFETQYAALVCVVVFLLGVAAYLSKIRYRLAIPCLLGVMVGGILLGNFFMQGVYKVSLVGTASYPAVVISQQKQAMVLFRGGEYNAQMVESYLERRNITELSLLVDLRTSPDTECSLQAKDTVLLSELVPMEQDEIHFGQMQGALLYDRDTGIAVLDFGQVTIATTSGTPILAMDYSVDVLLATSSSAGSVMGKTVLTKNGTYDWLECYEPEQIYAGEDEASLWVRYGGEYKFLGVENGK